LKKLIKNNNVKLALLLIYPLIVALGLEMAFYETGFSTGENLKENFLSATALFFLIKVLLQFKLKRISTFLIVFFYLIIIIETCLFLLFKARFNSSYLYVILNTNFNEIKEFSSVYSSSKLLVVFLFFIPILVRSFRRIFYKNNFTSRPIYLNLILVLIVLIFLKFSGLIIYNLPYIVVKSYIQYSEQVTSIEEFNENSKDINVSTSTNNDLLVVIIGESASRQHMSVYGYKRKTTQLLEKFDDSLLIYNDVISSHVYTTGSLIDAFTLKNVEEPKKNETLIPFFKSAGYQVTWLSNQRPVGIHDNMVSRLSSAADEKIYLSYNDFRDQTAYDEILLPIFQKKLKNDYKQVVFIHLSGSHYDYKKRVPKDFQKFIIDSASEKEQIINSYDNSIFYTDYIVSQIIKYVKYTNKKSAVVYFSDHGDEVYDTQDFFGHFEDNPTPAMYEIPFIVWKSNTFETPENFEFNSSRKFMLDDLPHSLTHLLGIKNDKLTEDRSLFSKNFNERRRKVIENQDYSEFKQKFVNE